MNYIEIRILCEPHNESICDVLMSQLGEASYDSFAETEDGVLAYIIDSEYDKDKLEEVLDSFPLDVRLTYTVSELENKNWNEEWEKNYFSPIVIENQCVIKSSFHKNTPDYKYTVIINPKMAFGTGHHQTTILMLKEILKIDLVGQSVLDMGCGTAILAIVASMRNAKDVVAIDIDEWAYDNAIENIELNNITNVSVKIGGAKLLGDDKFFDTIIANINRNILIEDMHAYAKVLNVGGDLFMSGFYVEDLPTIKEHAQKHNLVFNYYTEKDNWVGVKFTKR